ncbi:archaeal flagellin N-terminal-like domain-containing protein [Colletotrichum tofieldiae]|uniref:Archaeal flagellin N-terminal-like domain-containing protein n=1 Tax=Colletotrichum tofieldiae TaxID=708197 RepID=A0A166VME2_9PEZI|nr:archaeal flagellin N-terminal-like domain-containing protein [Colletotrichum tofieldiae]
MGINHREFLITEWILLALCSIVAIARLAVRTWHRIWSFWLSEIFLVLSLLFFLALVVGDTYTISIGLNAFAEEYFNEGFAGWKFASSVIFDLGFYFPRFSLLAFYYQLFPGAEKKLRLNLHLVTAYTTCAFFTTGFVDIFWCGADVSKNWADSNTSCTLANCPEPMYINWSIGITSELLVFALPFGILRLKALQTKDRRALLCIFLLGIATLVISVVRFYLTVQSIWDFSTCNYFPDMAPTL